MAVFKPANATRGLDRPQITYFLKSQPKAMTIDFLDAKGQVVRSITGQPPRKEGDPAPGGGGGGGGGGGPQGAPMAAGVNRYTWDLNSTGVVTFPGMILWGATQSGPAVLPGGYQVRLTADGVTQTQSFSILKHPLRPVSDADLQFQWDLASRIRDKVNEANQAVIRIRRIKTDITDRIKDAPAEVRVGGRAAGKIAISSRRDYLPGAQSERPGSAKLPDQDQQPPGVAAARGDLRRGAANGQRRADLQRARRRAEGGNGSTGQGRSAASCVPFNQMLQRIKRSPISEK